MDKEGKAKITNRYVAIVAILVVIAVCLVSIHFLIKVLVDAYFSNYVVDIGYLYEFFTAVIAIVGAYVIYKVLISIVNINVKKNKLADTSAEVIKLILKIILYAAVIAIVLASFGVSLTDALAGGAIGGIIIGLAVQTITSSILSGVLVSWSRTMYPGDVIIAKSSIWGSFDVAGRVMRVNILFTELMTINGNTMRIPNSVLFSGTIFTYLRGSTGIKYPLQVTVSADVPAAKLSETAAEGISKDFAKRHVPAPDMYLTSKGGGTNTFTVLIIASSFQDLNPLIDTVNQNFDSAYWKLKK